MLKQIVPSIRAIIVFTIFTGLLYPLVITGLAQIAFKHQANGSLVYSGCAPWQDCAGIVIGSSLIGQNFDAPQYFYPRPSAAGDKGYDANNSQGSNLGPTNKKLIDRFKSNLDKVLKENPGINAKDIPIDAITSSASGLDPHISPDYAMLQVPRVAKARGWSEAALREFVAQRIEKRQLGFLGEPRVNVLMLNLALDKAGK